MAARAQRAWAGLCTVTGRLGSALRCWCERGAAAGYVMGLDYREAIAGAAEDAEGAEGAEVTAGAGAAVVRHLLRADGELRRDLGPLAEGCVDLCGSTAVDPPGNSITASHGRRMPTAAAAVGGELLAAVGASQHSPAHFCHPRRLQ